MGMNTLQFGNVDLTATYGLYVDSSMSFNKPKKNVEYISIPGRSGDLVIDYGTFKNVMIPFPCYIKGNFESNFNDLMAYLATVNSYAILKCSADPGVFRWAKPMIEIAPSVKRLNKDGYFNLTFNCKPFRHLDSGSQDILDGHTSPYTFSNLTGFETLPSMYVMGGGTITIANPQKTYTIVVDASYGGPIIFDGGTMDVQAGMAIYGDPHPYVTMGDWPRIHPSAPTTVTWSNTFSTFELHPDWVTI